MILTGVRTALRYWTEVIIFSSSIALSTTLRRAFAAEGCVIGSSLTGSCTMPASSAACGSVSRVAWTPKYRCAAASIPYEFWPKYTMLR